MGRRSAPVTWTTAQLESLACSSFRWWLRELIFGLSDLRLGPPLDFAAGSRGRPGDGTRRDWVQMRGSGDGEGVVAERGTEMQETRQQTNQRHNHERHRQRQQDSHQTNQSRHRSARRRQRYHLASRRHGQSKQCEVIVHKIRKNQYRQQFFLCAP